MSRGPWNTGARSVRICRESLLAKGLRIILSGRKGADAPFPASGEDGSGQSPVIVQETSRCRVSRVLKPVNDMI